MSLQQYQLEGLVPVDTGVETDPLRCTAFMRIAKSHVGSKQGGRPLDRARVRIAAAPSRSHGAATSIKVSARIRRSHAD